jgi:hypothetical protein
MHLDDEIERLVKRYSDHHTDDAGTPDFVNRQELGAFCYGWVCDNKDPACLGRVRVSSPAIAPGLATPWIPLTRPWASTGSGWWYLPDVGTMVLIGFINNWHFEPRYFQRHLAAMNLNYFKIQNLIEAQDIVMVAQMYQPGAGGPYHKKNNPADPNTWCNVSTYDVAEATGFHTDGLYNQRRWDYTNANDACRNLVEMSKNKKIIKVSPDEAQSLANEGYTVIAAKEHSGHGHLSTVRTYTENSYNKTLGPMLANVGGDVGEMHANEGFRTNDINSISFYYDPSQTFEFDINKMHCKGAK